MKRQRRILLLVAAVFLTLGVGMWWLCRPNLDPRLIGRWSRVGEGKRGWVVFWDIRADGLLIVSQKNSPVPGGDQENEWTWSVDGDDLVLSSPSHLPFFETLKRTFFQVYLRFRYGFVVPGTRYEITNITHDRFFFRPVGIESEPTAMTRVPESP